MRLAFRRPQTAAVDMSSDTDVYRSCFVHRQRARIVDPPPASRPL